MKLLQYMGALGAMAHAPFISSVGPEFFIDSFEELPNIKDLKSTKARNTPNAHCVNRKMRAILV